MKTALLLSAILLSSAAANWPTWRGPTGNGTAPGATPPVEWGESKNVAWKVRVPGIGSASPVVWGDKIFVATAEPDSGGKQKFILICYDRKTGEILWQRTAADVKPQEGHHKDHGYASASPMTDGKHVFAHFGTRGMFAYTLDGEPAWDFTEFGSMTTRAGFGEGSSPTISGDHIIVPWDQEGDSYIMALDKNSGKPLWKTPRDEPTSWATPLVVGGQVIANGQNYARGYDLKTGKEIWRCAGQTARPVASPVANDTLAFVGSGHRGSYLGAFKYRSAKGDIEGTDAVAWSISKATPDIASLLLSDDRLYFTSGKGSVITCSDATTGKPHFERERPPGIGNIYASPIAAGGHVYIWGRNGKTAVIEDGTDFKIIATNTLDEGIDATPAFSESDIIIRTTNHLYRIAKP